MQSSAARERGRRCKSNRKTAAASVRAESVIEEIAIALVSGTIFRRPLQHEYFQMAMPPSYRDPCMFVRGCILPPKSLTRQREQAAGEHRESSGGARRPRATRTRIAGSRRVLRTISRPTGTFMPRKATSLRAGRRDLLVDAFRPGLENSAGSLALTITALASSGRGLSRSRASLMRRQSSNTCGWLVN